MRWAFVAHIVGLGSEPRSIGIGMSLQLSYIPDDVTCKLEAVASMFNDTVMGSCALLIHLTLAIG
jgi:hypothetical protein